MKQKINKGGYLEISLTVNRDRKTRLVHRLVGMAFIKNNENLPQINHKNGVRNDNIVRNLEWCTPSYNMKHSFRCLGRKNVKFWKGKTGINHCSSRPINQFKNGKLIRTFISNAEASKLGFNKGHLSECCQGKRPRHKGYTWEFANN